MKYVLMVILQVSHDSLTVWAVHIYLSIHEIPLDLMVILLLDDYIYKN